MRSFFLSFLCLLCFCSGVADAQQAAETKSPRILILLDESSSMIEKWGTDQKKFEAADKIILNLMDSIYRVNDEVEFSLRVFGHQYTVPENNCYDTKNEVMFSKNNYTQMSLRLASITPLGVTPIAYALKEAAENDLTDEYKYAYSIVLITDGGESCGGNLCDVVQNLLQRKIAFKPYIVSLVDYAPLRSQYSCLGNFLQVTSNRDIPAAVSTIVSSYRPMLMPVKRDTAVVVKKPVVIPEPVAEIPKPAPPAPVVNVPLTKTHLQKLIPFTELTQSSYVTRTKPLKTVALPNPIFVKLDIEAPVVVTPPIVVAPPTPPAPPLPPKTFPKKMVMKRQLKELSYFSDEPIPRPRYDIPDPVFVKVTMEQPQVVTPPAPKPPVIPPPAVRNPPIVKKPVRSTPAVVTVKKEEGKEVPFTIETVDAKETSVEIYLTNGKGKYYNTSPQVMINDPLTGNNIKKFYRTLDASNHPDAQQIKEGNYYMVLGTKNSLVMRNITVQPNKINKIFVVINNGTLKFEYTAAPNRPITEFQAVVVLRTDRGGPMIRQKCNVELGYDPGNYFIEINTLPVSRRNEDIDPGSESILMIDEPGYVQFTNRNQLGNVALYTPLGDRYAKFYSVDINGNSASQKLRLQPGTYQAHFFKDPTKPFAQETINTFNVKSNVVTEVELQ